MPLLPRSRRGTSLLAAAVWVAACAGLWWALPGVPLIELRLPEHSTLLGFDSDGTAAVICQELDQERKWYRQVSLLDVRRGIVIADLLEGGEFTALGHSFDSKRWLFRAKGDGDSRFYLVEMASRTSHELLDLPPEVRNSATDHPEFDSISPNGHYCVLRHGEEARTIILWDLVANRVVALPKPLQMPVVFSRDCKTLVGLNDTGPERSLSVIDLSNLSVRHTLVGPTYGFWSGYGVLNRIRLCQNGEFASADFQAALIITNSPPDRLIWDLRNGQIVARPTQFSSWCLYSWPDYCGDTWSGGGCSFHSFPGPSTLPRDGHTESAISPDGKTALISVVIPPSAVVQELFNWFYGSLANRATDTRIELRFYDTTNGRLIGTVDTSMFSDFFDRRGGIHIHWFPDGKRFAFLNHLGGHVWQIWDIPPRKSPTWFAAGSALLALPIGFMAWQRVRKLRAA